MSERVGRREDFAKALLRVLVADIDGAIHDLATTRSRQESIHKTRQRLKRARTVLRVLEPQFGEAAISARRALTDAARMLAGARDADVAAASAHELAEQTTGVEGLLGFDRVAAELDAEAARAHHERTPMARVNRRLAEAREIVHAFTPDFDGARLVENGMRRIYKRGRKAMRTAESSLSTPDLHRWRKSAKRLGHLVRFAGKRLPKRIVAAETDLGRLGDVLGQDNDHALLAERLALSPSADIGLMRQLSVVAERRHALEAEAFRLGAKLYRRKPAKFLPRVGRR